MTKEELFFELIPAVRAMFSGDYPETANFTDKSSVRSFPESNSDFQLWKKEHSRVPSIYIKKTDQAPRILREIRTFSKTLSKEQRTMPVWIILQEYGLVNLVGLPDISTEKSEKQVVRGNWDHLLGRLAFKVVIVTGGAQGFGAGIAKRAFEQGAHVVIADMNKKKGEALIKKHYVKKTPNRMIFFQADISDPVSVKNLMMETVKTFGGLDVLISNAGVLHAGGLDELTEADFDFVTKVRSEEHTSELQSH